MKLLIYGDIGGSGGYIRYCQGLLDINNVPSDIQVWFVSSPSLYEEIAPLDSRVKLITHPWMTSNSRFLRYLWYLWKYPRIVKEIKPDLEFYPTGTRRVYFRKSKTVVTCHNLLLFDSKELSKIKDRAEYKYFQLSRKNQTRSFLSSNAVIFLSSHSQQVVKKEINGIKQSTVISHGLDPIFLKSTKRSYSLDGEIRLLYVSPYYSYKHQLEVVKAIQILRTGTKLDIKLTLIGGGANSAAIELKEYVYTENLLNFIQLKGNMQYKDLLEEYTSSDIFVFASSCETFGITLLEAMGSRLPIACSNRSGLSEILKDAGVYFDPEKPESIADALYKLIGDIELRKKMGEKGYEYALEYTWKKCATETFNYIKNLSKNL